MIRCLRIEEGEQDRAFTSTFAARFLEALAKVHEAGLVHGDAELRNVLVHKVVGNRDFDISIQLIDFEHSWTKGMLDRRAAQAADSNRAGEVDDFDQACKKEMDRSRKAIREWVGYNIDEPPLR